jgi:hypothetical protein
MWFCVLLGHDFYPRENAGVVHYWKFCTLQHYPAVTISIVEAHYLVPQYQAGLSLSEDDADHQGTFRATTANEYRNRLI